jgi:hypothetical protein
MLSDKEYCPHEDEAGRRCTLGPGHRTPCLFGKSYRPSPRQIEELQGIAQRIASGRGLRPGVANLVCVGLTTVAALKALSRRGFIHLRYVNSRAWDASLTPAGCRLIEDLPR